MAGKRDRPQFRTAGEMPDTGDGGAPFVGDPGADDFSLALEQFGAEAAAVRIYKWGRAASGSGEEGWLRCGKLPASDFDLDMVPARWGPGSYRFTLVGADGRAVKHLRENFAAPAGASVQAPIQQPALGSVGPAGAASSGSDFFQQLALTLITNQSQMMLALIGRPAASADVKVSDVLTAFREGRELAPAAPAQESIMEAIRLGVEVGGQSAPPAGEGGGSMLENIAGRVLGLIDKAIAAPPPAKVAPPAGTLRAVPSAPAPTPGNGAGADPLLTLARQYAPRLLAEASKGRDGFTWGSFVAERVPEQWVPVLARLVQIAPADRLRLLSDVDPRLAQYGDWIEQAAEGIKDALYGDNASAPAGGSGDLDHGAADPDDDQGGVASSGGAGSGRAA